MDPWKHEGGWGVKVDNTDPNVEVGAYVGSIEPWIHEPYVIILYHGSMDSIME